MGPGEIVTNELGEVIPIPHYGEPGKDYVDMQFIARLKPNYLTLPKDQTEAPLDQCEVDKDLDGILKNNDVYYVKKVFPSCWPYDTLREIYGELIRVPDLSQVYLFMQGTPGKVIDAVYDLEAFSGALYAEPDLYYYYGSIPNDDW